MKLVSTFFFILIFSFSSVSVLAQTEKAADKVKLNAEFSMVDTLKMFKGGKKRVSLLMRGGTTYTGLVAEVGPNFMVLSQLTGRDFFDAFIRIEDISSLEVQVR